MKFENITMKIEDITMNCEYITMNLRSYNHNIWGYNQEFEDTIKNLRIQSKIWGYNQEFEDITMKFEDITSLKKIIGNPCKTNGYLTVHILYQRQNYEFTMYTQYLLAYFHLSI